MHMTNTRITDPEILERYYPVSLRQFTLRKDSGGAGKWRGGHGVVRELEFLRELEVGVLTERRALAPRGLEGGCDGLRGVNLWMQANGKVVNLGGKASVKVAAGDRCASIPMAFCVSENMLPCGGSVTGRDACAGYGC